ncbi:HNH endonuclease signature motif containing protein [Actinomycetospora chlora]
MSERVRTVERDALDRAREHVIAQRAGYHRRLQDIAALDELGTAVSLGYRSIEALIADRDNLDHAEAKRLVAEATDLCPRTSLQGQPLPPRLPATAAALAAGAIDPAHVKILRDTMRHLARLLAPPPPDELCAVEEELATQAQLLPPRMLKVLAKGFVDFYDPDGAAPPDGDATGDELRLHRRKDGSLAFKGHLADPMDAETAIEVFGVLAAPHGPDDDRALPLRQAEAFKDLIQDARGPQGLATTSPHEDDPDDAVTGSESETLALIPQPRRPEPPQPARPARPGRPGRALLTVTIDHRFLCQTLAERGFGVLDSGHAVDPATLRRWACDAEIIPMVLGSRSQPLDVGRTHRTAPDAIRRALHQRDQGCAFPGCHRRPRRCQAHHIHHWLDHGDTALHNMCLLCRYHHQLIHHGHWTITMIDGRPWFTPPAFIDPERRPRLGGRPRVPT